MAITIQDNRSDSMELPEFMDHVNRNYKHVTLESLLEIAPYLAKLARNRHFLEDFIIAELKDISTFQLHNPYSAQSLNLGFVAGKFYLRANIWLPEHMFTNSNAKGEQKLFSYELPHDHNFDFLTVGY